MRTAVLHTATAKPNLAVLVKPLRSFTYRCVKNALKRKRLGHFFLAVAVGFEPTVGCPTQHFECCTFGRSDTLPGTSIKLLVWLLAAEGTVGT